MPQQKTGLLKTVFFIIFALAVIVIIANPPNDLDEMQQYYDQLYQQTRSNDIYFPPSPYTLEQAHIDKVYVDKSSQILYLLQDSKAVKSYHIALGDAPKGRKQQEGDERTPEGEYILDYKNENSIAYRSIHISYPNNTDITNAEARGVSPGGDIMIHGQMNGYGHLAGVIQKRNWTDGCMAVTNAEMDEIMSAVKVGTPIEIVW